MKPCYFPMMFLAIFYFTYCTSATDVILVTLTGKLSALRATNSLRTNVREFSYKNFTKICEQIPIFVSQTKIIHFTRHHVHLCARSLERRQIMFSVRYEVSPKKQLIIWTPRHLWDKYREHSTSPFTVQVQEMRYHAAQRRTTRHIIQRFQGKYKKADAERPANGWSYKIYRRRRPSTSKTKATGDCVQTALNVFTNTKNASQVLCSADIS